MGQHPRVTPGVGAVRPVRVSLQGAALDIDEGGRRLRAVPSMEDPDFQRILRQGWVSPPSFGPRGDLRLYSAAHRVPGEGSCAWFASADWRRGRVQIDRRGAISDIAMAPYGAGGGKLGGEPIEIVPDYARRSLAITLGEGHSVEGRWTDRGLSLALDGPASPSVDGALACALFLWVARPPAFLVQARPPF